LEVQAKLHFKAVLYRGTAKAKRLLQRGREEVQVIRAYIANRRRVRGYPRYLQRISSCALTPLLPESCANIQFSIPPQTTF